MRGRSEKTPCTICGKPITRSNIAAHGRRVHGVAPSSQLPYWDQFDLRVYRDARTGCWLWIGPLDRDGYGNFGVTVNGGQPKTTHRAHRLSYGRHAGPIPEGLVLDHLCAVRNCVNPDHLEPVQQRVNVARGRHGSWSECSKGHPFNEENTYWSPAGKRYCRPCRTEYVRTRRLATKRAGAAS